MGMPTYIPTYGTGGAHAQESFVVEYGLNWSNYDQLARRAKNVFEESAKKHGIDPLPLCTARGKDPESVRRKLLQRGSEILDLAGIRILLYFPDQANVIEQILHQTFDDVQAKSREQTSDTEFKARIYHARVKESNMKDLKLPNRHNIVEVQVVSILMHAWAEVEHKRYKRIISDSTPQEDRVLKELNDIMLEGEYKLIELHQLYEARKKAEEANSQSIDRSCGGVC